MSRIRAASLGIGLVIFIGCANPEARDPEHELRKAEAEREQVEQKLSAEQSAVLALRDRNQQLRGRIERLQRRNDEIRAALTRVEMANTQLTALLEQRSERPLERPNLNRAILPAPIDATLRELAKRAPNRLSYDPSRGGVTFANDRLFTPGSATVRPESQVEVVEFGRALAQNLAELRNQKFDAIVVGHTDADPIVGEETLEKHPTNEHLAVHRAIAFKQILTEAGLPDAQVAVMGYGANRPISEDKSQNRRIEVYLVPSTATVPLRPGTANESGN